MTTQSLQRAQRCAQPRPFCTSYRPAGRSLVLKKLCSSNGTTAPHRPARSAEDLKDPAHIGGRGTSRVTVQGYGGPVSLNTYMTLPLEQYFVLDPSQITFLGGSRFRLKVPRINILNVWVEPLVEVTVRNEPGKVVLEADNCRIRGAEAIEKLHLDERFCLKFVTELTWESPVPRSPGSLGDRGVVANLGTPVAVAPGGQAAPGVIVGNSTLDVWSEVIPPFHLMPRPLLESTCNSILRPLVNSLLPLFVRRLAADYDKWARDEAYRQARAARSKPMTAVPAQIH